MISHTPNQKKPKVSVVIPTYGRSQMVKQAVKSALSQELEPYEVIVSDDNSQDNTIEVLKELESKNPIFRLIQNEINSGGVANWNKVIDAACGDYIAYCSDDDFFLPFHLKNSIEYLENHPEIGMVHSGFFNLVETNHDFPIITTELISKKIKIIEGVSTLEHITDQTSYPFQPSTLVFRKSLWESIGHFDTSYSVADTDWFIRVGLSHKIAYLPIASVVNRRHLNNWSNRVGSIGMNVEFHKMMKIAFRELSYTDKNSNLKYLKNKWLVKEFYKFIRIYIARSRAGLFEIASSCAETIWDIAFLGNRGWSYNIYIIFASFASRSLRLLQNILPGGANKYQSLGKDCPE